jgi:Right handed beta helix region
MGIMQRSLTLALAVVALLLVGMASAAGAGAAMSCDRFASPSGSDGSGHGSFRKPYRTPQKLANSLASGQAGCFRGGTYRFSETVVSKANVTLAPYRGQAVTLRGSIKVPPTGHDSTIKGLKLDGAGGKGNIGPRIYADGVVLRDNKITNHHRGICVQVSRWYSGPRPRGVVIERNRIHDCGELPATNHQHGIYVAHAVGTVIRDNWIYDNADRGVQLYPDAQHSRVIGNVIDSNGEGIVFSGAGSEVSSHNLVQGNIISNSKVRWNVYSGAPGPTARGNLVRHNCVWAGKSNSYGSHGGVEKPSRNFTARRNRVAKPRFAHAGGGNLRLRSGSRCRARYTGTLSRP